MNRKIYILLTFVLSSFIQQLKAQNPNNTLGFCFNSMNPSPVDQNTGNNTAKGLIVKDFNGDTYKDIVYLKTDLTNFSLNNIRTLRNALGVSYASGFIKDSVTLCSPANASAKNAIISGDFDNDFKPDLAVVDKNEISIYKNTSMANGAISFSCHSNTSHSQSSYFFKENYIDVADFDNDGNLDIMTIASDVASSVNSAAYIEFYKGSGTGNFSNWGSILVNSIGLNSISNDFEHQIIDYDGDGILDIVMNNDGLNNQLVLLKGTNSVIPAFTISPIQLSFPFTNNLIRGFKLIDINNDLKLDVVANVFHGSTLYNTYSSINSNPPSTAPSFPNSNLVSNSLNYHFIINDFNNDGQKELIGNSGQVLKLVKGEIANPSAFSTATNSINWFMNYAAFLQIVAADLDNNGFPDIITNNERDAQEYVNVILNFSYNNVLNPSNLNLTLCSGNSINVNTQLTPNTQGLSSLTQNWYKVPVVASLLTSPNYTITGPGNYYAVAEGVLPFSNFNCKYFTPNYTVTTGVTPTVSNIFSNSGNCIGQNTNFTLNGAAQYSVTVNGNTAIPLASNVFSFTPTLTSNTLVFFGSSGGCIGSSTSIFTANPSPTITVNSSTNSICGNQTVTLTASFTGSPVPFSFWIWNGVNTASATSVFTIAPTTSTNVSAQVIDNKGCISNSVNTVLSVFPNPTVQLTSGQTSICSNTTAVYSFSGASSYTYNPANGSSNNYTYTPGSSASFTVTGKDNNGCVDIKNYNLTINPSATVSIVPSSVSNTICPNDTINLVAVGTYSTLNWVHSNSSSITETIAPTTSTTYTLDASLVAGCTTRKTITIDVFPNDNNLIIASANTICPGDAVNLSINGNYFYYEWFPSNALTSSISVSPQANTSYTVKVIDNNTCQFRKTILVEVDQGCSVSVGNAITANNDLNNDQLYIANIERYANNTVGIFNRYGTEVFKTDSYDNKTNNWPKQDQVSKLTAGTYFYVVDLKNGSVLKGWVEVMK
jgi:gliding motility-associated-like protein